MKENKVTRRSVLKGAAAGMATIGLSGEVAAELSDEQREVTESYRDIEVIREVVAERQDLLERIHELELIEEPSVDALGVYTLGPREYETGSIVEVTTRETETGLTPDIRVAKTYHSTEGGLIRPGPDPDKNRRARLILSIKPEKNGCFGYWTPIDPGYICGMGMFNESWMVFDDPWITDVGRRGEFCETKCVNGGNGCNGIKDKRIKREFCPPPP